MTQIINERGPIWIKNLIAAKKTIRSICREMRGVGAHPDAIADIKDLQTSIENAIASIDDLIDGED